MDAAHRIAGHFDIKLAVTRCSGLGTFGAGYVRGRNALLLDLALVSAPFEVGQVAIGLHAGTAYADCTPSFLSDVQRVFDTYSGGKIQAVAPFLDYAKKEVVDFCVAKAVPLELTYSCERGTNRLIARGAKFVVLARPNSAQAPDRGRALIRMQDGRECRFAGTAGYLVTHAGHPEEQLSQLTDAIDWLCRG